METQTGSLDSAKVPRIWKRTSLSTRASLVENTHHLQGPIELDMPTLVPKEDLLLFRFQLGSTFWVPNQVHFSGCAQNSSKLGV